MRVVPEDPLSECSRLRWWRGWVTAVLTGHFSVCFEVRVVPRDHHSEHWLLRVVPVDPLLGCRLLKLVKGCERAVLLDPHIGCCLVR